MRFFISILFALLIGFNASQAFAMPNESGTRYLSKPPINSIDNLSKNYNGQIKYVFSDIDGTLIPCDKTKPKGYIPPSVFVGAEKLHNAKIPLFLATGRSVNEAILMAKMLGCKDTYVIGQQGAEIADLNGKIIYQDGINHKDSLKMLKEIEKYKEKNKEDLKVFFYCNGKAYAFENFDPPYIWDKVTKISSTKELGKDFSLVKIAICYDNTFELKKVQTHLKKHFPKYNIDISANCYCDISSKSATKGNGIKKVAELLKIDLKNVAVLGDAQNDISMLKLVKDKDGLAIAVGNAMPEVKKNANFITTPVNANGFEKAVENILKNNNMHHCQ